MVTLGFSSFFKRYKQSTIEKRGYLDSRRQTEYKWKKMACLRCILWISYGKGIGVRILIFSRFRD